MTRSADNDAAFDSERFDRAYPVGIEAHYWNLCRNRILEHQLQRRGISGGIGGTSVLGWCRGEP